MKHPLARLLYVVPLAWLAWSFLDPALRDAEGFLDTPVCLAWAKSAALALLVFGWLSGLRTAMIWLALALLGQAWALQLYEAGPVVGYQHYRPLVGERLPDLVGLVLQAAIVAVGFRPLCGRVWRWLRAQLRGWRLPLLAFAVFITSTKISLPPEAWVAELFGATVIIAVQLANLILVVRAIPGGVLERWRARFERLFGPPGEGPEPGGPDRFAWSLALFQVALASLLAFLAYEHLPHVPDEFVYLIHARYFAEGLLSLPVPPVPEGFDIDLMMLDGGRWFSPVNPGWPAVLALGAFVGLPWLVNPLLGGGSVLLAYAFLREIASRRTARIATALLAVSPWFTFLDMSLMNHPLTLFAALLGALGVARCRRTGKIGWVVLAGVGIGFVGLSRPLIGMGLALLLGLWAIGLGGKRLKWHAIALLVAVTGAVGALALPYNKLLTGTPSKFPIMAYADKVYGPGKNAIGFGPEKGLGWPGLDPFPGHGARDVVINANFNLFAANVELFGWCLGSLLPIFLLLLPGGLRPRQRWMLAVIALVVGLNSLYYFSGGPDFGARYWYLTLLPCILLAVDGLRRLAERLDGPEKHHLRVGTAVTALCLLSLLNFVPWRAVDKYHHYRGARPDVRELARGHDFDGDLVLVRGARHPDYVSAAIFNPLDLEADETIYAWDWDPAVRAQLLEHYRDRAVWILEGPSETGRGYELLRGPVPATALLAEGR